MNSYDKIAMKKVLIIAPNFPPESVGGASRIFEMAKKIQSDYDVSVICPPPTYPFTKYNKSNQIFKKEIVEASICFLLSQFCNLLTGPVAAG